MATINEIVGPESAQVYGEAVAYHHVLMLYREWRNGTPANKLSLEL